MQSVNLLNQNIQNFLNRSKKMLINGQWVESVSGKTFPTVNPATGEVLAHIAEGDSADVDRAVRAARNAFEEGPWSRMSPSERGKLLFKLAELIDLHTEELAQLETLDCGKPLRESMGYDVPATAEHFRYFAGWATKITGQTLPTSAPGNYFTYTRREAIGVCGQIIPWNFPLLMAAFKLAPALACGNTVVLKPAEQTPLTAIRLGELFLEAGFPDGVVNIVTGYGETAGAALVSHDDVDKIAFTGSTEVGKQIMRSAAGSVKKVSLELGGKNPNIIFPDADLSRAIPGALGGIFFCQGEVCTAGSRVFIDKKIFDNVVSEMVNHANAIKLGHGIDLNTEMGPLVSLEHYNRVTGFIEQGRSEGAEILVGGSNPGGDLANGYFLKPTIIANVHDDMTVTKDEIFGPVMVAIPFEDINEVIKRANRTPFGLAAGLWTSDVRHAHRVANALKAGTVWVNCYNVFDPAVPFGGYKQSGFGRECGSTALDLYTQVKSTWVSLD